MTRMTREELGRLVRKIWVDYCLETGYTDRRDRICPWEEMDDWSQEVDMRIGEAVYKAAREDILSAVCELWEEDEIVPICLECGTECPDGCCWYCEQQHRMAENQD